MALAHFLGAALPLLLLLGAAEAGGEVGVNYGRVANNLPDPASVVHLLKQNGITMVRLYDANAKVLTSLANTGIKVLVMLPNEELAAAASDPSYALRWARSNVAAYHPATRIHGVAVGNEVFDSRPDLNADLVRAMANVHDALAQLGLADAVKVSTPVAFSAVTDSYPPSAGRFRDDVAQSVMKPMLGFLQRTGSYLTINIYPYLAYAEHPDQISLDYALGNSNSAGVRDPVTGLVYHSLLDAQLDATYFAMEKLGTSSSGAQEHNSMARNGPRAYVSESGWPSAGRLKPGGRPRPRGGGRRCLEQAGDDAASVANAKAYNNYLINRVVSGDTGTPYRPDADMDVYIFALFNENQKGDGADDIEQHFGLFYPNQTKVYEFDFQGGALASWCVANASVGDAWLQAALEYACGHGADCSAIQSGGSCFQPDTKAAHASYAFNSYYQRNGRAYGTCDFSGAAAVVYQEPGTHAISECMHEIALFSSGVWSIIIDCSPRHACM